MEFQIKDVRIRLCFSFFAVLFLLSFLDAYRMVLYSLWAVALHELAHFTVLTLLGRQIELILFTGFGLQMKQAPGRQWGYGRDVLVAFSGPFCNLLVFLLLSLLLGSFQTGVFSLFAMTNLAMGLFELLPVGDLDGGQALTAFLCLFLDRTKACAITFVLSLLLLISLVVLGIVLVLQNQRNFSLLFVSLYCVFHLLFHATG